MVTEFGESQALELFEGIEHAAGFTLTHINLVTAYLRQLTGNHQAAIASLESVRQELISIKATASEAPSWLYATVNSDGLVCFPE